MLLMNTHRLRAPSEDGALLAVPPLSEAGRLLRDNADRLRAWDHDFQGRRATFLRPLVRAQVLEAARNYLSRFGITPPNPIDASSDLIVTGHQPELFHPGVWVKNFAAGKLAQKHPAQSLNLVVDNDIPKSSNIRAPWMDQGTLKVGRIDFDDWAGEIPYEDMLVHNEPLFESFPGRVKALLNGAVRDPILDDFWPKALERRGFTDRVGLRFAQARRLIEGELGVHNLEIPISEVCETEGFLWFATHVLAHLNRFQEIHNDALASYRALHKIRSRHHPVPALGSEGDWLEAPFWVWRSQEPRRRPLMVRQKSKTMELRIGGEDAPLMEIPLNLDQEGCCAVERLQELPAMGIRLRTRALTTTMFARFLLGDLFIHGIGGAKYDELGDEVAGRFFQFTPPPYLTLSLTLRLGLADDPASPSLLETVERRIRDLQYNPERHLQGQSLDPDTETWIRAKQDAILGPVETHRQRVDRFKAIRRCNEAINPLVTQLLDEAREERSQMLVGLQHNAISHSREFPFILHSRTHFLTKVKESLGALD